MTTINTIQFYSHKERTINISSVTGLPVRLGELQSLSNNLLSHQEQFKYTLNWIKFKPLYYNQNDYSRSTICWNFSHNKIELFPFYHHYQGQGEWGRFDTIRRHLKYNYREGEDGYYVEDEMTRMTGRYFASIFLTDFYNTTEEKMFYSFEYDWLPPSAIAKKLKGFFRDNFEMDIVGCQYEIPSTFYCDLIQREIIYDDLPKDEQDDRKPRCKFTVKRQYKPKNDNDDVGDCLYRLFNGL